MSDITVEEILELAQQLDPAQRLLLARRLEQSIPQTERNIALQQALIANHEHLRAEGVFTSVESLYGKFATPGVDWDEAEFDSYLHSVGTEWEGELDELTDDNSPN